MTSRVIVNHRRTDQGTVRGSGSRVCARVPGLAKTRALVPSCQRNKYLKYVFARSHLAKAIPQREPGTNPGSLQVRPGPWGAPSCGFFSGAFGSRHPISRPSLCCSPRLVSSPSRAQKMGFHSWLFCLMLGWCSASLCLLCCTEHQPQPDRCGTECGNRVEQSRIAGSSFRARLLQSPPGGAGEHTR